MSETFLRQVILEELEYEPSLDATHIGVSVEKGVVTLTGHVASFAQKQAAITAVRRINGVRAIAEEIEVRYPFEKKVADDEIAKRSLDILGWDSTVPARAIQVLVRNGWVTLTGDVDWQFSEAICRRRHSKALGSPWNHKQYCNQTSCAGHRRREED
jgi:osmotically-inducible protein OsmY